MNGEEKKELQLLSATALVEIEPMCKVFVDSGIFEDVKSAAQAIVKVLAGREIGLSPLESMMNLYIVKNRVAASAKVISSLIKKSKKYDYQIVLLTNEECTIIFFSTVGDVVKLGESTFTMKDAAKAGIVNGTNWKSYPRNMLFARAMSNGARWFCPDVYCGYIQEELESIDIEPEPDVVTMSQEGEIKKEEANGQA